MKENQRIAITKRLLKEALLTILKKKDIDKITVSELCAEAGINRATFYRHYEIPLDVLHDIQDDYIQESNPFIKDPDGMKSLEDIGKEFERICIYMKEHDEITKILLKCSSDKDLKMLIEQYCTQILKTKYGKILDEDSLYLLVNGLAGGAIAVIRTWLLEEVHKTPKEMAEIMVRFISYGSKLF